MTFKTFGACTVLAPALFALALGAKASLGSPTESLKPQFLPAKNGRHHVGPMPGRPVLGDLNRDGKLDIVVACGPCCGSPRSPQSGHLFVLMGDGKGQFRPKGAPIKLGPTVRKVALGDMNGDRILDAVAVEHDSYAINVLIGDGKGGFLPGPGSPVMATGGPTAHVHEVALGDVNGDGKLDVFTTQPNDHVIAVMLGDGRGRIAPAPGSPFQVARHPYDALIPVDANGDGKLDLIVPDMAHHSVRVLFGNGTGAFTRENATIVKVGERPGYVAAADFNSDGHLDICASHDDVPMVDLLFGDGKGGFTPAPSSPYRKEGRFFFWGMVAQDVNGDKKADLLAGVAGASGIHLMLGDGKGGFKQAHGSPYPAGKGSDNLAVGDLDGDRLPDIVVSNYDDGTLNVLLNTGATG